MGTIKLRWDALKLKCNLKEKKGGGWEGGG